MRYRHTAKTALRPVLFLLLGQPDPATLGWRERILVWMGEGPSRQSKRGGVGNLLVRRRRAGDRGKLSCHFR